MRRFIGAAALAAITAAAGPMAAAQERGGIISSGVSGGNEQSIIRTGVIVRQSCRDVASTTPGDDRTVVECVRSGSSESGFAAAVMPPTEREELRFHVPGYRAGDGERHVYVLTWFYDSGVGNTNIYPDEDGLVQLSLPVDRRRPGEEPAERSFIISSADAVTGELRFSMELEDVQARAFVNALYNALMNLEGDLAQLRGQPRQRRSGAGPAMRNYQLLGERRISLAGENLGLEATLDLLYEVSGCSVFLQADFLAVESCR